MDEGRKRVIGIMAAILTSIHMTTADDLFGTPQGSSRTDRLIAASVQWAQRIMEKIDERFPQQSMKKLAARIREEMSYAEKRHTPERVKILAPPGEQQPRAATASSLSQRQTYRR